MKYRHVYSTWGEFITAMKEPTHNEHAVIDSRELHEDNWTTRTWDEALGYLTGGWKTGLDRLTEFKREIPSDIFETIMPVQDYKPELRHNIAGGVVDINAYLSGATPETFLSEHRSEEGEKVQGKKLKTLYVNVSNSSGMPENAFFYRGALSYHLIEHLEACGYSCEVWAAQWVTGKQSDIQQCLIKVKEFGELFDNNKLAIALASSFMLRRFIFAIQEKGCDREVTNVSNHYKGIPVMNGPAHEIVMPEDMDLNPLWIGTVNECNKDDMIKKFQTILKQHNDTDVFAA